MGKNVKMDNENIINNGTNEAEKKIEITAEQYAKLQEIEENEKKIEEVKAELAKVQKEISDAEMTKTAKNTQKELKNTQKMVAVTIPVSELNPMDKVVPVTINGYTWQIKRGEEVLVPEEVKRILKEAKYI